VEAPPEAESAEFTLDETSVETVPVAPLSAMARDALDRAMGGILVRAVARALTKYLATEAAQDQGGEGVGLLVNLLGLALESAETRSWRTLPYEIRVATIEVGHGTHVGVLRTQGKEKETETVDEVRFDHLEVPAGGIVFARYRSSS
jgi:hypothetical protein